MKSRIEDEDLLVGLSSEEFEDRVRDYLTDSEANEVLPVCQRITVYRGELPKATKYSVQLLWWFGGLLFFGVFIYGACSLVLRIWKAL